MRRLLLAVILLAGCGSFSETRRAGGYESDPSYFPDGPASTGGSLGGADSLGGVLGLIQDGRARAKAVDFELIDTFGEVVRLADYRGRVVVVQFWAVWCSSCDADLRDFQLLHEKYGDRDLTVLGLAHASGSRRDVEKFADSLGVSFPMLLCVEEVRSAYDVAIFPTTALIDREGRIRLRRSGRVSLSYWERAIEQLLAEG